MLNRDEDQGSYYGFGCFVLDSIWFGSLWIYFWVWCICLLCKYWRIWVHNMLYIVFLMIFSQMNLSLHTDNKRFIKTTSETSNCALEIKCGQFIWPGPCKSDTKRNVTKMDQTDFTNSGPNIVFGLVNPFPHVGVKQGTIIVMLSSSSSSSLCLVFLEVHCRKSGLF